MIEKRKKDEKENDNPNRRCSSSGRWIWHGSENHWAESQDSDFWPMR